jgi:catechol 2,3-dioxygenase-like lactoylglutathione lyase family enzyme
MGIARLRDPVECAAMLDIEHLRKQAKLYLRWHRQQYYPVAARMRAVLPLAAMTTLVAAEPQLYVRDISISCEFYARMLGFSVAFTYGEPPFYGQVVRDGVRLNLRQIDDPPVDPARRDAEQLLAASITLKDAKPLFVEYQKAGVEFVQPLRSEPWGARTFIVRDPDGNLLLFAGRGE